MHWLAWRLPFADEAALAAAGGLARAQGWWALRFTPQVSVLDEALLLDVASAERLWGGRASLRRLLLEHAPCQPDGIDMDPRACWAEAPTALQALALLRLKTAGMALPQQVPQGLPLFTLTALRPHISALNNLGCRTLGAVRALPRTGLARRLGADCLQALDQLWGERAHPLPWITLPEHFDLEVELPHIAASSAELLHAAEQMLGALQSWLRSRHLGILRLQMRWRHDLRRLDGVDVPPWGEMELRTAEPLQELSHLRRLLGEQLALQRLAAPVNRLALRSVETASLAQGSNSLLPPAPDERTGEPWHQFVERVSARLGEQCLRVPQRQADHRPEQMQAWKSAASLLGQGAMRRRNAQLPADPRAALWPAWLLAAPQPLALRQHRPLLRGQWLRLLAGPERFESGWWESEPSDDGPGTQVTGEIERDYFVAYNAASGWVWVFRDNSTGSWFLHGLYG